MKNQSNSQISKLKDLADHKNQAYKNPERQ